MRTHQDYNGSMDRVDKAFQTIRRENFLPREIKSQAHNDWALPIGFNQTNSQPTTVRLMLSWLDARPGQRVLDVGSGSGWTSALLAYIVGPTGQVKAVERIPELVKFGASNCQKIGLNNVRFFQAGEELGLLEYAPYDRILVSATADSLPEDLIAQLSPGGRMVIPVHSSVLVVNKSTRGKTEVIEHPGFIFVPLL